MSGSIGVMDTITANSDKTISLEGARDAATGSFLNAATVGFTLYTSAGAAIAGGTGSMSYVAASDGNYRGVIESTVTSTLTVGSQVYALITLVQSAYNADFRVDFQVVAPGQAIIDPGTFQSLTGQTLSATDLVSCSAWCMVISRTIQNAIKPYSALPVTLANVVLDAPADYDLLLPVAPARSITSVYLRYDAHGLAANFTSGYLLDNTTGGEYQLVVDDRIAGHSRNAILRRVNRWWAASERRQPGKLGGRLAGVDGAILVNYEAGFLVVPDDIQGAAVHLVNKMMNSRKFGTQVTSASLNGGSYSLPASAVGNIWSDPVVAALLRPYRNTYIGG